MTSEPMLPTSASPVAMPILKSHVSMGVPRTPKQLRNFATQDRNTLDHFDDGEAGEAGVINLVDERRAPIGHDAVTDIFVDDAPVAPDRFGHDRQIAV